MGDSANGIRNNGDLGYTASLDPYVTNTPNAGITALAGSLLARGETNSVPYLNKDAFGAYANFRAGNFADARDIRLTQLRRIAQDSNNSLLQRLRSVLEAKNIENVAVAGRAKAEGSLFNKLLQYSDTTIGKLHDISAARLNINVINEEWAEHRQLKGFVKQELFPGVKLKINDYLDNPTATGYQGRLHILLPGKNVPLQELQIGSQDLSDFIDKTMRTKGGDTRSLHDLVYKGKQYGLELSPTLKEGYQEIMALVAKNDKDGLTLQRNPELAAKVSAYYKAVASELPDHLPSIPSPSLTIGQKIRGVLGKSFGALGAIGSLYQAVEGSNKIRKGDIVDGTGDMVAGTTAAVSSVALIAGRTLLSAGTGGVAAAVEGSRDLYLGIRDGNNQQIVSGGLKGTASGLMLTGACTANPFIIGAGAVLYLGTSVYENREVLTTVATSAYDYTAGAVSKTWNWARGNS